MELDELRKEYKDNEKINAHTENCLMPVHIFGNEREITRMKEIATEHKRLTYMPHHLIIERDNMVKEYYRLLFHSSDAEVIWRLHFRLKNREYMLSHN